MVLFRFGCSIYRNLSSDEDLLYTFQIDISTNSREIKYRNMGIGLLHVKRNTRQKLR